MGLTQEKALDIPPTSAFNISFLKFLLVCVHVLQHISRRVSIYVLKVVCSKKGFLIVGIHDQNSVEALERAARPAVLELAVPG